MLKKLLVFLILMVIPVLGQSLKLDSKDEKILADLEIKVSDVASIVHGYVEDPKVNSTIILGKIVLPNANKQLHIYDPWDEAFARMDNRKITNIILNEKIKYTIIVITDNNVNVLVENKSKENLKLHYPFKIKIKHVDKKQTYYPKDKEMCTNLLIETPGNDGYLYYLYWNGKKYVYVWVATDEIDQG